MNTTVKIKLTKAWNYNSAGSVLDVEPPIADLLLERKIAIRIVRPKPGRPKIEAQS